MITEAQKQLRAGRIGSSDAAAILGLDPFRSASDVYLEKTGQAASFEGNEHTTRGNLLEPVVVAWAEKQLNKPFVESIPFFHPSGLLIANLDAFVAGPEEPAEIVEAKTTVSDEEWGEEGTDQIPERVLAQVHHQFVCVPTAQVCWVPVLMPTFKRFEFRMYRVERNDDLCSEIELSGLGFMRDHVVPRVPPSDFRPSLEVLKRVRRVPKKTVPVASELVERYVACCNAEKLAMDQKEKAKSYLLAALGDAEGGEYAGGAVTYMEVHRKEFVTAASTYRQLRVKPQKQNTHPTRDALSAGGVCSPANLGPSREAGRMGDVEAREHEQAIDGSQNRAMTIPGR